MLVRIALLFTARVTAITAGLAVAGTSGRAAPTCGVERWAVKTLQDPAGKALNLSEVTTTTVPKLRALRVSRGSGGSRGGGVESTVYQVRARLVEAKLEDDSDIHLVVKGLTTSGTM